MTDARATIDGLRRLLAAHPPATVEHGTIQFNLGLALAEAPHGERDVNLRAAIGHYAEALRVFGADRFPVERSRVLNALGAAERELGLLVQARDRFQEALEIATAPSPEAAASPEAGAAANNLGLASVDLGEAGAAVDAYGRALESFAAERYPRQRAAALHNRGQARAALGDLAAAAADYRAALELARPGDAAYVHGSAQLSLAVVLLDMPGDRTALAAEAVAALGAALAIFTRTAYPFQHAIVKHNLGIALEMLAGDHPTGLRRALASFEDAVQLLDPRLHEAQWREAKAGLDRAEARLGGVPRPVHFARLLADVAPAERRELLRYRLRVLLDLPEPHRTDALFELDRALVEQPPDVTISWMHALMEQPGDDLAAALAVRVAVFAELDDERRDTAARSLEAALGDLQVLQRVAVRDRLEALGYERPDGS